MTEARVAKRYARALFNAARDQKMSEAVEEGLSVIRQLLRDNERFAAIMEDPNTEAKDKAGLITKTFTNRVADLSIQAVNLLIRKKRMELFPLVVEEYIAMRQTAEGVVHVTVTSATELTEAQRKSVLDKVGQRFNRQVEPEFRVDPSLIGGVRLAVGNTQLDGSVRGSLDRLHTMIIKDLLKQS